MAGTVPWLSRPRSLRSARSVASSVPATWSLPGEPRGHCRRGRPAGATPACAAAAAAWPTRSPIALYRATAAESWLRLADQLGVAGRRKRHQAEPFAANSLYKGAFALEVLGRGPARAGDQQSCRCSRCRAAGTRRRGIGTGKEPFVFEMQELRATVQPRSEAAAAGSRTGSARRGRRRSRRRECGARRGSPRRRQRLRRERL